MPADSLPFPPIEAILMAIEGCPKKECHSYADAFIALAKSDTAHDWRMLFQVFNFLFRPKDALKPFQPMMVSETGRSMIPEDLTDPQLNDLQGTLNTIADHEYRARVADTTWLRRRDASAARVAVTAYLESGKVLEDPQHWVASMERYERSLRLARQIEPKGELPRTVLAHLEARVKAYDGDDPMFFTLKALTLLAEFQFGDFAANAAIAGKIAEQSRTAGTLERARSHYDLQAKLLKLAKDAEGAEQARVAHAETYVIEAEAREAGGSFIAAHHFWQLAVKAFRDRPSLRSRVPELQKKLAKAGKESLGEMKSFSHEIDIKSEVETTESMFAGLSLDDALCLLAVFLEPIDPVRLKEQTEEGIKESPLHALFAAEVLDSDGRKIAHRPAASFNADEGSEPAIEHHMHEQAGYHRGVTVAACIVPAMRAILSEHEVSEADIERILAESGFIPKGRLPLFVKGVIEGFRWDLSTALHLLVPQAENSLRCLLESRGIVPRNVDKDGVEEVWRLDRILEQDDILKMIGASHVYELQSLLTARLGPNLRNGIAHGLLSHSALSGDTAVYAWWVLFRLAILPSPTLQAYVQRQEES